MTEYVLTDMNASTRPATYQGFHPTSDHGDYAGGNALGSFRDHVESVLAATIRRKNNLVGARVVLKLHSMK